MYAILQLNRPLSHKPGAFYVQFSGKEEQMCESEKSNEPIGACSLCHAPIYAGEPRRGIWRRVQPPRIVRTCICYDVILGSIQYCLIHNTMMPGALALMPVREDEV
jgi:hypothetical protein